MVMAMGQDRSRPGGPYVTAGLKKISGASSDTVLQKKRGGGGTPNNQTYEIKLLLLSELEHRGRSEV